MYVRTEIKVRIIIMGMLFQAAHKAERNMFIFTDPFFCSLPLF